MEQGTEAGVFEEAEHDIVKSIFKLADRAVSALMKQRREVVWPNLEAGRSGNWVTPYTEASRCASMGRVDLLRENL